MRHRVILHADLNSFFATAEQQTNPQLRGKPVGVLKAKGRTCIIAASVEAKRYGVKTGSRVFEAKKLCPQIILIPANFSKYEAMSMRFINICKRYSPTVEVFSLDECFIDVTETEKFWGNVFNIAFDIKDRLRREVGDYMTCSIGVSYSRVFAKLAGEQIKPDGLFWITEDNVISILDKSGLTDVCGLGWGLSRHLMELGICDFPTLRSKSFLFLYKHFGPNWSVHLYNIARGIDNSPLVPISEIADAKSVGRTYTTHKNLFAKEDIHRLMRNLCEEVAAKARAMHLAGRYVGVVLRGGDRDALPNADGWIAARNYHESWYGHKTLKNYIDDGKWLFDLCVMISRDWPIKSVRFCGVTLGMLVKKDYLTTPLFATDRRKRDLVLSLDKINGRFGDYTVYPAQLLGMPIIRPEVTGYFGDRAYRLKDFSS